MTTPSALLLITPICPHCPAVLEGLTTLVKEGRIGSLEVVNIAIHPERAAQLGVRSVPWCRIGPIELTGSQSPAELKRWAEAATSERGIAGWLAELLATGRLPQAEQRLRDNPAWLPPLVLRLEDPDTPMQVRVGIGAIFEGLHGSGLAAVAVPVLGCLAENPDARIRADACHYLGFTESMDAAEILRARLQDEDPEVREIAAESLDLLP